MKYLKVLIVASYNTNSFSPFVLEQVHALSQLGIEFDFYGISGKRMRGYFSNRSLLQKKIQAYQPNIIHAHYGLSGLLANLQRKIPVITTYHGSDIHSSKKIFFLSKITMLLSAYNIFVSQSLYDIAKYSKKNCSILSCGIDLSVVKPINFYEARNRLGWDDSKVYILFSGSAYNAIKNYSMAKAATESIENAELIELKGYTKEEVALLMSACNLQLTTSFRESGPLVVKEAMACNRPIVTTDVGDVREVIGNTEGCYITSFNLKECTEKIKKAIIFSQTRGSTNGRERIIKIGLDNSLIAKKITKIYNSVLND